MSLLHVVRRHKCPRTHKTYVGFARCVWPEAQWVLGDGPYASVRGCAGLTVLLHPTMQQAESALLRAHPYRVPGESRCDETKHELVALVLDDEGGSA